jgi:cold shock CspA family protein
MPKQLDAGLLKYLEASANVKPARVSLAGSAHLKITPAPAAERDVEPMLTGRVCGLQSEKRYGFVAADAGGPDVFFHFSALASPDDTAAIHFNTKVEYAVESQQDGRLRAKNIRVID